MSILVTLEQRGRLKTCALEAACAAAKIAAASGLPLNAVYIGKSLGEDLAALAGTGIDTIYAYEHEDLHHYSNERYVEILCEVARELGAQVIMGSATALGKEFFASAAARLRAGWFFSCARTADGGDA